MYTRRDFARFGLGALGGLPLAHTLPLSAWQAKATTHHRIDSTIHGVRIGIESYSFATLPHDEVLDVVIASMAEMGLNNCGLWETLILPPELYQRQQEARGTGGPPAPERRAAMAAANDAIKQWQMTVSLDFFKDIRKKFDTAGIDLSYFTPGALTPKSSDEELQRACDIAHALGTPSLVSSMSQSVAKRFAPFAEKNDLKVGLLGGGNVLSPDSSGVATTANFLEMVGYSKNYGIQLDIGDATGGGLDALQFVKDNYAQISAINLKDRGRDKASKPWGEGDSHVKEVLLYVRDNKYPIPCYIDCDYPTAPDSTRIADIKRSFAYIKTALAS